MVKKKKKKKVLQIKDATIYQMVLGKLGVNSGWINRFIKVNILIIISTFLLITIRGHLSFVPGILTKDFHALSHLILTAIPMK